LLGGTRYGVLGAIVIVGVSGVGVVGGGAIASPATLIVATALGKLVPMALLALRRISYVPAGTFVK
jgi:hypothetical protein